MVFFFEAYCVLRIAYCISRANTWDVSLTTPSQRFQKDAILRQMQEYKREKVSLESRVSQMSKAAADHNDRLRIIDSWFRQVSKIETDLVGLHPTPGLGKA